MELDETTRVRLSARSGTTPEVLRKLAADPSVTVRAALALNSATPAETDAALARDPDERVRTLIARKLGALAPSLSSGARTRLQRETLETLTSLAGDEAARVRAAIADAVKDMADVPRAMILRLAGDESVMVCEPVIRFSPLLTPEDLVALVAAAPSAGTRLAVARRASLDPGVSDALVANGTDDVILALLMNGSAGIREATLDALAERSAGHSAWHAPLVRRPALSARAVVTLSRIVADHLLAVLAERGDLAPDVALELRAYMSARLDLSLRDDEPPGLTGTQTEADLLAAARDGDSAKAAEILALAADVPLSAVRRAATLRSAKGLVSLVWKAGFTMTSAYAMQILLARLPPGMALEGGSGNSFPLSAQEMRWQLDFLSDGGR